MLKYITRVNFKRYEKYETKQGYIIFVEMKYRILRATSDKLKTIFHNEMVKQNMISILKFISHKISKY